MKARKMIIGIIAVLIFASAVPVFASESTGAQDSIVDKVGDWFATIGKSQADKQIIIADRRTKRILRHTRHELEETNEQAQKEVGTALGK